MIQRIQSLWLLLAAIIMFLGTKLPFAEAINNTTNQPMEISVDGYLVAYLLAIILSLGTLIIIFLFRRRSTQRRFIWLGILSSLLFTVLMYFHVEEASSLDNVSSVSFKIGAALPVIYIVLMALAYAGVRKDEKLIRSVDRLR